MAADIYGGWIKPDGKIIDVYDACQHVQLKDYGEAKDEGWIAFTYANGCYSMTVGNFGMSFRFDPIYVTDPAIKTMQRLIKKSQEDTFFISDIFMNGFTGYNQGVKKQPLLVAIDKFRTDRTLFTNTGIERDKFCGFYDEKRN